jgi:hypothetical protein
MRMCKWRNLNFDFLRVGPPGRLSKRPTVFEGSVICLYIHFVPLSCFWGDTSEKRGKLYNIIYDRMVRVKKIKKIKKNLHFEILTIYIATIS